MSTPLPIADSPVRKSLPGLVLIFLALVAGIVVAGMAYHGAQTAQVRSKVERELSAIATLKVNELAAWRAERLSDARFLQRDETLAALARDCIAQPAAARPQAALTASLRPIQASHDYAALLFDAGGRVCFAAPANQAPPAAALRAAIAGAQQSGEVTFLDFYRNETSREIFLALLVPIRGPGLGGRPVGVLVMQIDPRPYLYATLQRWPLPSTTAEMLLVRREGDEAIVLNGPRARPAEVFSGRIPLARSELLTARAARGQEGFAEGADYGADHVVAALRKIPDSPWFLVARLDTAEAYAAAERQFHESLVIIVSLILCVGTAMGLWWRNQFARHYREKYLTIEAQRESEERYRSLVESSMDAVLLTTPDGRILSANATACRMFGATEAELTSLGRAGIVDATDPRLQAALAERAQTGRFRGELTMVRRDGTKFPAEVSSAVFSTSTGEACTSMVIHDITQRQRSEATLRLQSAALTSAANGIVITDRHGIVVWVNPAFTRLTGYTFDEAVGKNPRDLVKSGAQEQAFYEQLWATIIDGHTWHGELVNRRKDGSLYPEEQTITPVRDATGEITHFIGIKQDLTERRRAEEARRASEQKFQSVFEQASVGVVIAEGPQGRFVNVNRRFCAMVGYTAEELLQLTSDDLTHPEDLAAGRNQVARINQGIIRDFSREKRYRKKDGSYMWARVNVAPLDPSDAGSAPRIGVVEDITDRKQAETALRESETMLRESQAIAGLGSYVLDIATGRWTSSEVLDKVLGIAGSYEHSVAGWVALIHPEDRAMMDDYFSQHVLGRRQPFDKEYRIIRQTDQAERWVWGIGRLECDELGQIARMRGTIQDITDRKRAVTALRESEARYRLLFEHAPDAIFAVAATGAITSLNQAFETITGWPAAEWMGQPFQALLHPDDQVRARELFQRVLNGEPVPMTELRVRTAAGGFRDVEFTSFASVLANSGLEVHGIGRDITARKIADHLLREQNEILANAHEGVMIVNLANEIILWNRGAEEIFGWPAAEALDRPPEQMLGAVNPETVAELRTAVERDGRWHGELRARTRDGRDLTVDCRTTLVRDAAGAPRARLNFLSDVTEKKMLEEKFLHAQRLESLGMLAAGIAHDLNNVLAPIVFAAPMLRDSLSTPRDLKILATLESSAARGSGLVKQILGFAHSTTGDLQPVQVKHLARDVVDMIEETFPKSIRLEQQIPSDLWIVRGNATQIHQVLLNLCVNARDAMPDGGTLRIAATNRRLDAEQSKALPGARPGAWLVIEIGDSGIGITPEVLAHIWDPFFTTKGAGKGTGLGLSTVRGIVASHHGFIALDTKPGHGSTFRVFFPALEEKPAARADAAESATPGGHGELLLVVDDDDAVRDTLTTILAKQGYRTLSASDGVEAISHFTTHSTEIALVITDVDMPHIGGGALARILNLQSPGLPLLVISGLPHNEGDASEVAAARKLAQAFLLKPFSHETLLATVHTLLHPTAKA